MIKVTKETVMGGGRRNGKRSRTAEIFDSMNIGDEQFFVADDEEDRKLLNACRAFARTRLKEGEFGIVTRAESIVDTKDPNKKVYGVVMRKVEPKDARGRGGNGHSAIVPVKVESTTEKKPTRKSKA